MTESTTQVTVGSILGRSLNVTLKNFVPFLVIALIFQVPNFLFDAFVLQTFEGSTVGKVLEWIVDMVFGNLVTAAILFGVFEALRGKSVDIGKCVNVAMSVLVPVIIVSIVSSIGITIGLFLLIVPGIILALMWYVAVPVTVIEKAGLGDALSRSADLTKGHRLTLFVVALLFLIIGSAVTFLVVVPLAATGSALLAGIALLAIAVTIGLWSSATAGVVYHDLRMVKDGLGADDLAEIFS